MQKVKAKLLLGKEPLREGEEYGFYTPLKSIVKIEKKLTTLKTKIIFNDLANTRRSVDSDNIMSLRLVIGTNPFTKKQAKFEIPVLIDEKSSDRHRIVLGIYEVELTKECKEVNLSDLLSN